MQPGSSELVSKIEAQLSKVSTEKLIKVMKLKGSLEASLKEFLTQAKIDDLKIRRGALFLDAGFGTGITPLHVIFKVKCNALLMTAARARGDLAKVFSEVVDRAIGFSN